MSCSRYLEYKSSGIEWLGEVPVHWGMVPLKYLCHFSGGGTPAKENLEYWNGDIPWVSPKDMKLPIISNSIDKITPIAVIESSTSLVKPGALLMVVRSGILQRMVPVGVNSVDVTINQDMKALRFFKSGFERYFAYLVKGFEPSWLLEWRKQGATVESIEQEYLDGSMIPVPPEDELINVLAFLDHETAKIDALIREQERLIKLLQEKRQAVISHAVTKGLDPDVPMKDSGVEWLGKVPAHWVISKLAHYASLLTGYPFPSAGFSYDDSHIRLLRGANVGVGSLRWTDTVYWELPEGNSLSSFLLKPGQIVFGMDRPWINDGIRIALVTAQDIPCLLLQRVAAITPEKELDNYFLYFLFGSDRFKAYIEPDLTGVSVPHISPEQILSFKIPLPPYEEQKVISQAIALELGSNSQLVTQCYQTIELLIERRSALISAAVTGKIDVRDWQPPADESAFGKEVRQVGLEAIA